MYGEDVLIIKSVWSNNEDEILLDNKPRDVMGLDRLAENIISDEFSDDNE